MPPPKKRQKQYKKSRSRARETIDVPRVILIIDLGNATVECMWHVIIDGQVSCNCKLQFGTESSFTLSQISVTLQRKSKKPGFSLSCPNDSGLIGVITHLKRATSVDAIDSLATETCAESCIAVTEGLKKLDCDEVITPAIAQRRLLQEIFKLFAAQFTFPHGGDAAYAKLVGERKLKDFKLEIRAAMPSIQCNRSVEAFSTNIQEAVKEEHATFGQSKDISNVLVSIELEIVAVWASMNSNRDLLHWQERDVVLLLDCGGGSIAAGAFALVEGELELLCPERFTRFGLEIVPDNLFSLLDSPNLQTTAYIRKFLLESQELRRLCEQFEGDKNLCVKMPDMEVEITVKEFEAAFKEWIEAAREHIQKLMQHVRNDPARKDPLFKICLVGGASYNVYIRKKLSSIYDEYELVNLAVNHRSHVANGLAGGPDILNKMFGPRLVTRSFGIGYLKNGRGVDWDGVAWLEVVGRSQNDNPSVELVQALDKDNGIKFRVDIFICDDKNPALYDPLTPEQERHDHWKAILATTSKENIHKLSSVATYTTTVKIEQQEYHRCSKVLFRLTRALDGGNNPKLELEYLPMDEKDGRIGHWLKQEFDPGTTLQQLMPKRPLQFGPGESELV